MFPIKIETKAMLPYVIAGKQENIDALPEK